MLDQLSERSKNLSSRGTMMLSAFVLLFGSCKCLADARFLHDDWMEQANRQNQYDRHTDPGYYLLTLAVLLFLPAVFFLVAAIVPTRTFARLFKPPMMQLGDLSGGEETFWCSPLWKLW